MDSGTQIIGMSSPLCVVPDGERHFAQAQGERVPLVLGGAVGHRSEIARRPSPASSAVEEDENSGRQLSVSEFLEESGFEHEMPNRMTNEREPDIPSADYFLERSDVMNVITVGVEDYGALAFCRPDSVDEKNIFGFGPPRIGLGVELRRKGEHALQLEGIGERKGGERSHAASIPDALRNRNSAVDAFQMFGRHILEPVITRSLEGDDVEAVLLEKISTESEARSGQFLMGAPSGESESRDSPVAGEVFDYQMRLIDENWHRGIVAHAMNKGGD